jgi:hypothetical protein
LYLYRGHFRSKGIIIFIDRTIKAVMTPLAAVGGYSSVYESGSGGGLDQPFPHQFLSRRRKAKD